MVQSAGFGPKGPADFGPQGPAGSGGPSCLLAYSGSWDTSIGAVAMGQNTVNVPPFTVVSDSTGMRSPTVNRERITIAKAGKYLVAGNMIFDEANSAFHTYLVAYINNSTYYGLDSRRPVAGDTFLTLGFSTIYQLSVGDYLTLVARDYSGGMQTVYSQSAFSAVFLTS